MNFKKTALCSAVATAMGVTAGSASADVINGTFNGWFTMLNSTGTAALTNDDYATNSMYGRRTEVTGTLSFDTVTGGGSGTVDGFSFFGSGLALATTISFQAIGDGNGGPGSLVIGNMGFNWNNNNGIPVSIVMDAAGFFGAGPYTTGQVITGGVNGATEDFIFNFAGLGTYTLPMGAGPFMTTTWNTTDIGSPTLGTNPSGTLPLSDDGIGGSPMPAGPFTGFNANFDVTDITVTSVVVPVPAAVWLFGSGLLGLVSVARRRKSA